MTNSNDRFNQIEELLRQSIIASDERMTRMEQLTESNSRSIQALADRIAELALAQEEAAEEREELRRATIGIANLLASLDSDRPTILRKLSTIENKVDQLLQRDNG